MSGWLRPSIIDNDIPFHSLFALLILLLKNVPVVVDRSANFLTDAAGGIIQVCSLVDRDTCDPTGLRALQSASCMDARRALRYIDIT